MHQSHDAEKRRGWVATTYPLVAAGLKAPVRKVGSCLGKISS